MKYFCLLLICCLFTSFSYSQTTQFSNQQLKSFEDEARGLVEEYLHSIPHLVRAPASQRGIIIENIKNFFVPGSTIEVSNSRQQMAEYSLDKYLGEIVPAYGRRFNDVLLSFKQVVIDPRALKKVIDKNGQTTHEGDFSYTQVTCFNYKDNLLKISDSDNPISKYDFCDETKKRGKFVLMQKYSSADGDIWEIRLGDIWVNTIKQTEP
jgi:hypothetical protein